MNLTELQAEVKELRRKWRSVRDEHLDYKKKLMREGYTVYDIRHDHACRILCKKQQALSVRIKHREQKLNRKLARGEKG